MFGPSGKIEIKNGCGYIEEYNDTKNLKFKEEYNYGEKNGEGEEYDKSGYLIYKGEYLSGKGYDSKNNEIFELKNGEGFGLEYYYNNLGLIKFKGTYLNGERKKGQEYDIYGNLQFEGEYSNRNKYLKGKEYIFKGNLVYEGEY